MGTDKRLDEIMKTLRQSMPYIRERYYVGTLQIFGSYTRAEQTPTSDLDLLATFAVTPSLLELVELENYLSDLLGINVDLIMKDGVKPALQKTILAEAVSV